MLQYILAGVALGSIYAIASSALVVTYVSSGVLNFAFGSMAFVVARVYFWLNSEHGMSTWASGLLSILVLGPLLGIVLYLALFRFVRGRSTLIKLVTTIGLSVALPPICDLIFGTQAITSAPGLAALGDEPYKVFGAAVTTDQVITYGFLLFVLVAGTAVLKFTDVGLRVRAMVDSEAMTSLSGTNPNRVALGVWAVSATLAGLAGVLVAPTNGLTPGGMTTLMAAAFAAVVVARLTSLPGAVAASLGMGIVTDVIQKYLPADSTFTADIIPSIPFAFIVVALVIQTTTSRTIDDSVGAGGPLDRAVKPANANVEDALTLTPPTLWGKGLTAVPLIAAGVLPLIFHGSAFWLGLTALGMCYGITFLTFTVVTGEGGMLWLSQIAFAGTGAMAAAQFVTVWHVPALLAILMGAVIAGVAGALIGFLTIRLGDLYVALATLTFGLLVETLIFSRDRFLQGGLGVTFNRPSFAQGDLAFAYLAFGVFLIFGFLTWNLRRSTSGLALRAVRDSASASRTLGLSVVQVKVLVSAFGAFTAAVGGGFLALDVLVAQPSSYATFAGLAWLAVVVTMGLRSITAAVLSGLAFALLPGVFQTYVPARWGEVPAILFGLGAISVARNPEGVIVQVGRLLRGLLTGRSGAAAATPLVADFSESVAATGDPLTAAASQDRVNLTHADPPGGSMGDAAPDVSVSKIKAQR